MTHKLDLLVGKGSDYSPSKFSLAFDIKNNDNVAVSLSNLKLRAYLYTPYKNFSQSQIVSGVNSLGTISQLESTPGIAQVGTIDLNTTDYTFTVYHNAIDVSKIAPSLSLIVPTNGSQISPLSISNRTSTSFTIVLDSPVPTEGYKIAWTIAGGYEIPGSIIDIPEQPSISLSRIPLTIKNGKIVDTVVEVSWPGSIKTLGNGCIFTGCEVFLQDVLGAVDFSSSYSTLEDGINDNSHFALFEYINSSWTVVVEYKTNNSLDLVSGVEYTTTNNVSLPLSQKCYIDKSTPTTSYTGNSLLVRSNSTSIARTLLQYNTSSLTNMNNVKKAILRIQLENLVGSSNISATNNKLVLSTVNKSWTAAQATWAKANTATSWTTSGGDIEGIVGYYYEPNLNNYSGSPEIYVDFDVTSILNYWIHGGTNNGFILKFQNESLTTNDISFTLDGGAEFAPTIYAEYEVSTNPYPSFNLVGPTFFNTSAFTLSATNLVNTATIDVYKDGTYFDGLVVDGTNAYATLSSPTSGDYKFTFVATSSAGVESSIDRNYGFYPFAVSPITPTYTSASSKSLSAYILQDSRFTNQSVVITSGAYNYPAVTVGSNGLVEFSVSAVTSAYNFIAKVTPNGGPTLDYPFSISLFKQAVTYTQSYPIVSGAYVVPTSASFTTTVTSDVSSSVVYVLTDSTGTENKQVLGSVNSAPYTSQVVLPPSTAVAGVSEYKYVKIVVNGKIEGVMKLYVKNNNKPTISSISSTTATPINIVGSHSYDLDLTNTLIPYSISNVALHSNPSGSLIFIKNCSNTISNWSVAYTSTTFADTQYKIVAVDNYGLSNEATFNYPSALQNGTTISNTITIVSPYVYKNANEYVISSGVVGLSANNNIVGVVDSYYTVSYSNTTISASIPSPYQISIALTKNVLSTIQLVTKTRDGSVYYSNSLSVIYDKGPETILNVSNCSDCYCSGKTLSAFGSINTNSMSAVYADTSIPYSVSAYMYDSKNNLISTISNFSSYNIPWSVIAGVDSLRVETVEGIGRTITTTNFLPITTIQSPSISLPYPNGNYNIGMPVPFQISTDGRFDKVDYYVDGVYRATNRNHPSYTHYAHFDTPKTYVVSAIGVNSNCSVSASKTFTVSNNPFISIDSLDDGGSVVEGTQNISMTSYTLGQSSISAVNVVTSHGVFGQATNVAGFTWIVAGNFSNAYGNYVVSAFAYDYVGNYSVDVKTVNVLKLPTTSFTVSGSNNVTVPYNSNTQFDVVATPNSGGSISTVIIYDSNGNKLDQLTNTTGNNYTTTFPTGSLGSGTHVITVVVTDTNGTSTSSNVTITIQAQTTPKSKPSIVLISSTPETRVSSEPITSIFEVSDYNNGIIPSRITLESFVYASIIGIEEVIPQKVYRVEVEVDHSSSVTVIATNFSGVTASYTVSNYVIRCAEGRKTNLVNYLPEYLRYSSVGASPEIFEYLSFFEDYLNTIYTDVDGGCNISMLDKTYKLRELHDIDKIDSGYIPYLSNMMGYDIDLNREEIASYQSYLGEYNDSKSEYVDKILRFVVKNLPSTYNIKTTRNAIKILLLSFGIMGNVLEYYTTDYLNDWVVNNTDFKKQYVEADMDKDYFPTPHISIGIDLRNTPNEIATGDSLQRVLDAVESIRPANIVVEGITGLVKDVQLPSFTVYTRFETTNVIEVRQDSQNSNFKATA
jgi:hypothetical protein